MDAAQIDRVRRFDRTVTERVGVLHDHYLGRDRPVGEARLLWEIGEHGQDVRTLREAAGSLLAPLDEDQRARLVAATAEVERLLTATTVTLDPVDPDHPDAAHCLRACFAELRERFDTGFGPARSLLPDAGELRPPLGLFLVARLHGEPVGCAGLKLPPGAPAEIRRMWVSPGVRGLGLGRRFLAELEARAARHGRDLLRMDTNRALGAARSLYHSYGFREVPAFNGEPYAHHWFEKTVTARPGRDG
ncbi:GNAT family N-acetyltransferase [Streptomyces sp. NPDC059631]|uniref:GNAT family N-acetyltransferase n=1 Tax=unclassified Streptomyces TaxID=2593676 RepID=UPI003676D0F0